MTFAILGFGRFGKAFADLLVKAGHSVRVYDPAAAVPPAWACSTAVEAVVEASWIVLAMPVPYMRQALMQLRPHLHTGQTVIDVGSVKMEPCGLLDEVLGDAIAHVGTHPLFGPLSLARGERPLRTVICASARHPEAAARAHALFETLGCEVLEQTAEAHDRVMAQTHALAFFIAKGLVDIGADDGLPAAPPSFQGMKNMLAAVRGDAGHLFAAIQRENPFAAEARARLLAELTRIHEQLERQDDDTGLSIPEAPSSD
ncbi:prephenate dehydrogenase/arogenate dehydrogenase family protein [Dyella sp. A6]|uniref:prephenate dehydrogenase/arogenate dehydrogenase family protein n=1 Tax=Dyella aluminiiresistens TaxID=3069105 RepID=UPI002E7745B5|nr:prephenate dehydrogenase/arogenate dehydrogenase family protein [Dyella sp. A6]